ncbi:MAG: MarR family winged helix-turn-helix transcriptional regulator [Pseudomonadota bacterium]
MDFNDELLRLDNQLCFHLYAASRQVTRLYRPLLDELGITYPQYLVLLALWQWEAEGDAEPVTAGRIGRRLMLDAGTLTPLLRRMEDAGLLSRERAAGDGRELHVALTRSGRALKKRAARIPQTLVCTPGLPVNELPALRAGLGRLLDSLAGLPDPS